MTTRIPFRGVYLDQSTIDALLLAETLLGYQLTVTQGSWSTAVAASGGTHAGAGVLDVHVDGMPMQDQRNIVEAMRAVGFAAWRRRPDQGNWPYHCHAVQIGNPGVSPPAAEQLVQWAQGLDGLADHGPDDDPVDISAGRPPLYVPPVVVPPADRRKLDEEVH